jgi:hypothetical protein
MIAIPEVVEKIVKRSAYLDDALARGILNLSALARSVRPEVEKELMKEVQTGAIVMALRRLSQRLKKRRVQPKILRSTPDVMVRSNLTEVTFANSDSLVAAQKRLLEKLNVRQHYFVTFTQGVYETTIIFSSELAEIVKGVFRGERVISRFENLSSITVQFPTGIVLIPGVYSTLLKALAWEGINIIEVVSTCHEFTLILEDANIKSAFGVIKGLF